MDVASRGPCVRARVREPRCHRPPRRRTCASTSSPFARPGSSRSAPARGSRFGRGRTCAGRRASARSGRTRLCCRTWNFGFRLLFSIMAFALSHRHSSSLFLNAESLAVALVRSRRLADCLVTRSACRRRGTACPARCSSASAWSSPVRRRDERDVHPVDLLDHVVVDLREDHLLLHAQRVVAAAVERPRARARGSRGCAAPPR